MRSRAVLCPATGDPFLLKFWFKTFTEIWADEVDRVYICLATYPGIERQMVNSFIMDFMRHPKIEIWENINSTFPNQFKAPLCRCKEELYVYIQEDAFITSKGALSAQFEKIENDEFDLIGSSLSHITPQYRYFWCNYLFGYVSDIHDTDMNFDIGTFEGETFDIMGSIFIQLQKADKRIDFIQQNTADWCHINSLSSINNFLMMKEMVMPESFSELGTKVEILKRIGWWKTCLDMFRDECQEIQSFCHKYDQIIHHLMKGVITL